MLTIIMTNWPNCEPGIMLVDFDEDACDEATAEEAVKAALLDAIEKYWGDEADGDEPCVGDVIDCLDPDILAAHGIREVGDTFDVVSLEGYDNPRTDF